MEGCTTLKGENLVRARPVIGTADASFSINGRRDELGDVVGVHVREDDNEAGSTDTTEDNVKGHQHKTRCRECPEW